MAATTQNEVTDSQAEWNAGTLSRASGSSNGELVGDVPIQDSIAYHYPLTGPDTAPLRIGGIVAGFKSSNLSFTPNQFNGSSNIGEIGVTGTYFEDPYGKYHDAGVLNSGLAGPDSADYIGFVMYSETNIFTRFSQNAGNAENLIIVRYLSGTDQWQHTNNTSWINFTPVESDRLLARVVSTSASSITLVEPYHYPDFFSSGQVGPAFDTKNNAAALTYPFTLPSVELGVSFKAYQHQLPSGALGGIISVDASGGFSRANVLLIQVRDTGAFVFNIDGMEYDPLYTFPTGQWVGMHINWRSSDGLVQLYINGAQHASATGHKVGSDLAVVAGMSIGVDLDHEYGGFASPGQYFDGLIAPPVFYSRILTDSESKEASKVSFLRPERTSPPVSLAEVGRFNSATLSWESEGGLYIRKDPATKADLGSLPALNEVTVELTMRMPPQLSQSWFLNTYNGTDAADNHFIIGLVRNGADEYSLSVFLDAGGTTGGWQYSQYRPVYGETAEISMTFNNVTGDLILYADGVEVLNTNYPDAPIDFTYAPLRLGYESYIVDPLNSNSVTDGLFGPIKVWDKVRSQAEIQADLGKRLSGSEPNLIRYWRMEERSGTVVADATGNVDGTTDAFWFGVGVECRVSLDNGSNWSAWSDVNNGDPIPGIPDDTDCRDVLVQTRQRLYGYGEEYTGRFRSMTLSATGSRALMKRWDGAAWVEHTPKTWQTDQWVAADPRVFTNGRWL